MTESLKKKIELPAKKPEDEEVELVAGEDDGDVDGSLDPYRSMSRKPKQGKNNLASKFDQ